MLQGRKEVLQEAAIWLQGIAPPICNQLPLLARGESAVGSGGWQPNFRGPSQHLSTTKLI